MGNNKTEYIRLALGLVGIGVNGKTAELIWKTVAAVNKKKGKFSIEDAANIEVEVTGKFERKCIIAEEDKKKIINGLVDKFRQLSKEWGEYDGDPDKVDEPISVSKLVEKFLEEYEVTLKE